MRIDSGIEIAPLTMPLSHRPYRFNALPRESFHGLPGLLADSLSDKFGNQVTNAWLVSQGRKANSIAALEHLCYIGARGMGALEYEPRVTLAQPGSEPLAVDDLVRRVQSVIDQRAGRSTALDDHDDVGAELLMIGGSAGGARAKAVIAWNPDTGEVRSGQAPLLEGFEHWLIKFDGIQGDADKELADPQGYGRIEAAYTDMARDAGIDTADVQLFEEGGRAHCKTRRFDRTGDLKRHTLSCAGLMHMDFNTAGAHGYEDVLSGMKQLGIELPQREELVRRAYFSVAARNQDGHPKNIAFLMDRDGVWNLAPGYDLTYAYNPAGAWTGSHQMTINRKRDEFLESDLLVLGTHAGMKASRARKVLDKVREAVRRVSRRRLKASGSNR